MSRIRPIGFDKEEGIKILLYGRSGTGKTTLWSTFPKPILAIVCSGGNKAGELRSIDTPDMRKQVSQVVLEDSHELKDLVDHAKGGRYKTIVLDHANGFQDQVLKEILGLKEIPVAKSWGLASQQQYGQCSVQCKEHLRHLLGCDINVVVIAQERSFRDETANDIALPYVGAGLTPSLTGWLNTAVDYICQTYLRKKVESQVTTIAGKQVTTQVTTDVIEYCLRTAPSDVYQTKFRKPRGTDLPEAITDPSYDKIMSLIQRG